MTGRKPFVATLLFVAASFFSSVGALGAQRATLQGRVVNSWSCAGPNDSTCAGVPGVTVLVFARPVPEGSVDATNCSPRRPILARTVSNKDGQFAVKTLRRNDEVQSIYCMHGYMPYPSPPQTYHLVAESTQVVIQLFKEVQDDADAAQAATWVAQRVDAQKDKGRSAPELYAQEFEGIATLGLPIESRALIARAVALKTDALIRIPRLREYAALDPNALSSLRTSIKDAIDAGGSAGPVLLAKGKVSTSVVSEVFLDEYRKRGSEKGEFAWQSLGKDLGVTAQRRTPQKYDPLPEYDVVGPSTFPREGK